METTIETVEQVEKTVNEDGLFNRIWERIEKALPDFLKPRTDQPFTVYKSLNGELRWLATFTNNFLDRDKEIISEKALDGYLNRVQMGLVPMPELWEAHIPETKLGQADMVFAIGNFVHADGHFDNTPENQRAIQYYRKNAAKIPLSHGFTFPTRALKNGVYEEINTFEVTLLPPPLVASNPFTDLEVNESMKQITPEQEAALAQSRGKEFVEQLKAERLAATKELVEAGVAYKDFADVSTSEGEAPVTPTAPTEDATKPFADLMASVLEDMNELLSTVVGQGKAIKSVADAYKADKAAFETRLKAAEDENAKLRAELRMSPRASEAAETKLSETEAAAIKEQVQKAEADPFWNS